LIRAIKRLNALTFSRFFISDSQFDPAFKFNRQGESKERRAAERQNIRIAS
jgi:hypothetical protein